jgi:predicted cupin superfamily sugar epimerase
MNPSEQARARIDALALRAHPEGGHFREIHRSRERVRTADGRERVAMTVIHFLLEAGQHSRWHEVRSDEQWTFVEGATLELFVLEPGAGAVRRSVLGHGQGEVATTVVPAGAWQAARASTASPASTGHALVVCTVAPGFEFADFRMLADVPGARARLERVAPELVGLL